MIRKRFFLFIIIAAFAIIGFLPILQMFVTSIRVDNHFSLMHYRELLSSGHTWTLLKNSLALSILTMILSTIVGVPLGLLLGKTDLPFKKLWTFLFALPWLLPPYITAIAWFGLWGKEGLLAGLLNLHAMEKVSTYLFGLPGCVLVLFSTLMPIVMVLTMVYARSINAHLEEAARLAAPWPMVLRRIVIPLIQPAIVLSAVLVFLLAMGEFSVPMYLRFNVFPVESFTQFSAFYNYSAGTAYVLPLVLVTFLILLAERRFLRDKIYQLKPAGGESVPLVRLGRAKKPLLFSVCGLCFLVIVLPLAALFIQSASLETYIKAAAISWGSLWRSIYYALIGATILTVLGFFLGYLVHAKVFSSWRAIDSLTIFLFALPGTVIGIGLAGLWNTPSTNFIYGTAVIIIFGYIAQYTALSSRITVSALAQIPPSMEESAQMAGSSWLRRILLIIAPLAKRGLLAAWLVSYIFCLKDTGISMIVYPPGQDTLPVRTFTLMANSPEHLIAALCVIMIAITLIPVGVLGFLFRKSKV